MLTVCGLIEDYDNLEELLKNVIDWKRDKLVVPFNPLNSHNFDFIKKDMSKVEEIASRLGFRLIVSADKTDDILFRVKDK